MWYTAAWSVIRAVCGVVAYPQTFNCPDITVEVIGNHSSRFPSMQSTYGLFSLLWIQRCHSFGVKTDTDNQHDRLLEHISDQ
jgi:uncharacterized PurR-regulated membrane protein YhhQ (DUF165 family)